MISGTHTRETKARVGKENGESGRPKIMFFYFLTLPGIYLDMEGKEITSFVIAFTEISLSKENWFS